MPIRFTHRRIAALFTASALMALPPMAAAQPIGCERATMPAEQAICANERLTGLDSDLSAAYRNLLRAQPQQRSTLRQSQRDWLHERDACGMDVDCLLSKYFERTEVLQLQLHDALAYQPDTTDRLALDDLRRAVEAAIQADPEFPLERAMAPFLAGAGLTRFANVRGEGDDEARFPTRRPEGVTQDEWRALLASQMDAGGENGSASYELIDLDGDGQRDLVLDSYVGGTGLFSFVSALRREGKRFGRAGAEPQDASDAYLYSLNGRGANQDGQWIRIRDRVYAAYRVSYYGEDNVYLLRPFKVAGQVPRLSVRYRYALSVPKQQRTTESSGTITLDDTLHEALNRAVRQVSAEHALDVGSQDTPLCPIPPGTAVDLQGGYYSYGPGHYTFEIIGDTAVHLGERCLIGRVVNWFGGYQRENGLFAQLWTSDPSGEEGGEAIYEVKGKRTATGVEQAIARVEGDNGA